MLPELVPLSADNEPGARQPRSRVPALVLLVYIATLSTDAVRKLTGLSNSVIGLIYILVGITYFLCLPKAAARKLAGPRLLPVFLAALSFWCLMVAIAQRIPPGMALLGWLSYVFFVPLFYVGAELMADDRRAGQALRVAAIAGGVVGLGGIASAVLGPSAPALLEPLIPSVGIHSSSAGNIYLAPSIFATAEEASEQLLVAFFAWLALEQLPAGKLRRPFSAALGILIVGGLVAAARRAEIDVAVGGIVILVLLGRQRAAAWALAARRVTARSRLGTGLALAALGSVVVISFLGAGKLLPFLTSGSAGGRLSLILSAANPVAVSGQGPGTSTQGASVVGANAFYAVNSQGPYVGYTLNGRSFVTAEGGLTKTWLELGIVGVILYAGAFLSVLGPPVRSLRRLDGSGRALAVLAMALGVVFLKGHQSLDNPLIQPLFWLAAGGAWGRMRVAAAGAPQESRTAGRAAAVSGCSPGAVAHDRLG